MTSLKRSLGPISLIFYSIGIIIGAGIYSVIGPAAAIAGDSLWLSFLAGAVVATLTGLSYAEMTTAFPAAGAEYAYLRRAWPRREWLAFTVAVIVLVGGAATASTVALAFGGYLKQFVDVAPAVLALLLLVGCTLMNVAGLRESSLTNIVFTCIEIAGLILVIAAGMTRDGFLLPLSAPVHAGTWSAAAILFFVYLGFEEIANMAEEVHEPARNLPLAIFVSIGVTTTFYMLVSLSVLRLVDPADLGSSSAPLATALEAAWRGAANLLSAIALFATANTVLITLIASSRLIFSMGRDGIIHQVFARLTPRKQAPAFAAVLMLAISAVLIPFGSVKLLAEASSFAALLAFLAVNVTLIVMRYREPDHHRPFRVPLAIGRMPIIPVIAIFSICILLAGFDLAIYASGVVTTVVAIAIYLAQSKLRSATRRPDPGDRNHRQS